MRKFRIKTTLVIEDESTVEHESEMVAREIARADARGGEVRSVKQVVEEVIE